MPQRISEEEIRQQVLRLMSQLGISPARQYENLILDGEIHRYVVEGDRRGKKNGAYCIYTDGLPAGFVQDWKRDVKTDWKYDTSGLSQEERTYYDSDEYRQKAEEERKKREAERKQKQIEASEHARILFESLKEAPGNHKYLQTKQIYSYGLRIKDTSLAVPLRDMQGIVRSIQWINADGTKKFYSGASTYGLFWSVALDTLKADTTDRIYLCEGMATGAKAYELTNIPTAAALTCANLTKIAETIRKAYPKAEIVILADDDRETENNRQFNPGLREAAKAVKAGHADVYISPPFKSTDDGTDWDDYALKYGDEACQKALERTYDTARIAQKRERYEESAKKLGLIAGARFIEFCKPVKGSEYLIEDWLPSESLTMLFAPRGSGNGFIVCDMEYAISNPEISDWHGKRILKHGPVIYVAGEGQRGLRKRFAGLVNHKGLNASLTEML
ncbi:MAG: toprim domain-containing protein, partial [Synergistaceae bacterium]|nr:toprim domain-containing protein [Synergistaceae bacterium]